MSMQNDTVATPEPFMPGHERSGPRTGVPAGNVTCIASPDELREYAPQIAGLASRALIPNVMFETDFLFAAWTHFFRDNSSARVILARDPAAGPGSRAIGLLPLAYDHGSWGGVPLGTGFRTVMKLAGAPLLDRDMAAPALDGLLAAIRDMTPYPSAFLFDEVPCEGAFANALSAALARGGWRARSYAGTSRVVLDANGPGEDCLAQSMSGKKRKEYRRLANRLRDKGALRFEMVHDPERIAAVLEEFLRLEKDGWKGANRSAILDRADWREFFRDGVAGAARSGQARIARLSLDGSAIAAALVLTSGDTAWFYKIAYDESLSQFSPGVLLTIELTKALCDLPGIRLVDSCANDDHPMIARIWRERRAYHDLLIVPPDSPARLIFGAETLRRETRAILKRGYQTIRKTVRG